MLLSLWFFWLLVGGAAASLMAWAVIEIRRRAWIRSGKRVFRGASAALARFGAAVLCVALALTAVADGVNRHFEYIPTFEALMGNVSPDITTTLPRPGTELAAAARTHGSVIVIRIAGQVSHMPPRGTLVYLPPEYFDPGRGSQRFPVLYLLHGSPGVAQDWIRGGYADRAMDALLQAHRIRPFLIVFPDFNMGYFHDTECEDIVDGPQVQTYLVRDVVSYIDSHFRTVPDRRARAIGGLSTGAYCAINLTFRHPDVFSVAISHSGYDKPDVNAYTGDLFGGNQALRLANTPSYYLPFIPLVYPIGAYLDAGSEDRTSVRESLAMAVALRRRGVVVVTQFIPGTAHTFVAWRGGLHGSLLWLSDWFVRMHVAVPATPDQSSMLAVRLDNRRV